MQRANAASVRLSLTRSIVKGLVTEEFAPSSPDHLRVQLNDVIRCKESRSDGWYLAESKGQVGWIPAQKVQLGKNFKVEYQYLNSSSEELRLDEGCIVVGFLQNGEWWFGESNGCLGWFPANYVQDAFQPILPKTQPGPQSTLKVSPQVNASTVNPLLDGNEEKKNQLTENKWAKFLPSRSQPAIEKPVADEKGTTRQFKGKQPLQYALWGHNLGLASGLLVTALGFFAILWTKAKPYDCKIDGKPIATSYTTGTECDDYCCDPNTDPAENLRGSVFIGLYSIILGIVILLFENRDWGFGNYFPTDTWWAKRRIPIHGILYILTSIPVFIPYATMLAGSFVFITGCVYVNATLRGEAGDGGRGMRKKQKEDQAKNKKPKSDDDISEGCNLFGFHIMGPLEYYRKIRDEDTISIHFWVFLFFLAHFIMFVVILKFWYGIIDGIEDDLLNGTLDTTCGSQICNKNKNFVKNGPMSHWAPWAKVCGGMLNLDCALVLIPVNRLLLRKLNNAGVSFSERQKGHSIFSKFFASPVTRYVPLSKNIAFHKLIAKVILVLGLAHTIFHFFNLYVASIASLEHFSKFGWGGTTVFTGAVICLAMFFIYTAATDEVRHANYEIFFATHHWFTIFFIFMFLHGPVFYMWAILPIILYIWERILQILRGNRPYFVNRVEWIPPVLAIQFRPLHKEDFPFKEGQYLYLNCPFINPNEWHPFTISSAQDDLFSGPRICLATGEGVIEVPRPNNLPPTAKWRKYCPISKDWKKLHADELLDKHETGYNDYISLHIKVHGLETIEAKTWTRKLKEYFELMNPGDPFPFYFTRRDEHGEIQIGKRYGPDGSQILRVDGPHSAPSEHYDRYNTVMIIGAGIGLTPCASIISSLLKYRWKKNFTPEILHFYWVLRWEDVVAFQWFIHLIADLEYELKHSREQDQIDKKYYCEMNIYITATPKDAASITTDTELRGGFKLHDESFTPPEFTADQLYRMMRNPTVSSRNQIDTMKNRKSPNRLQDVWVWNGRPDWDSIFAQMKLQRQHPNIGVCFCGAPVIGRDLKKMCKKYSSHDEDILFSLHKENF